ncbi:MAG: hypothetical protein WDN04_15910 [Rhodospirillales bacterium]
MSMLYLGFAAQKGRGQLRDLKQAEYWYCTAYKKGSLTALTYYGRILFRQGKFEQAEQVFRSGVVIDDQSSMYWLANVYLQYNGLDPRAIELLTRACARGHIFARRKLGGLMLKGRCGWKQIPNGARLVITAIIDALGWQIQSVPIEASCSMFFKFVT